MKVEYAPAVKRIMREQKLRQVKALAKQLATMVALVAFVMVWLSL